MTPEEVPGFLAAIQARVATAAPDCAMAMGRVHQRRMQDNELVRFSHAPGTKTPSPPGAPPALISGALRNSVTCIRGPGGGMVASALTGPHTVYASIQEYGGHIYPRRAKFLRWEQDGQVHFSKHVYLPPRPYVRPSRNAVLANGSAVAAANVAFLAHVWGA